MSNQTTTPLNNDVRYDVKLTYYKVTSFVVYEMIIKDLAMGNIKNIVFRFSEIQKFHDDLLKKHKFNKDRLPEFPKKNSFGLWNRTNSSSRMIDDRKRDLEYYFTKLFNDPFFRSLAEIKTFHNNVSMERRRRARSMNKSGEFKNTKKDNENEKSHMACSLPKEKIRSFNHSQKDGPFN